MASKVHQITVWARGVVQDKEGRDIANGVASAAGRAGKFTQAFDNYVDLPDRVIVADATIVKGINILRGMEKGGTLVVATDRKPEEILKFIPNKDLLGTIVCVDAKAICGDQTVDFSGSEGGVDSLGIGQGISAPILGALARGTDLVTLDSLDAVVKNKEALHKGHEQAVVKALN